MHSKPNLILCERSSRWAVALRQALTREGRIEGPDYRLIETRLPEDCLAALAEFPQAALVIELQTATADADLALIRAAATSHPQACVLVAAARDAADYECLVRELGAAGFASSPRNLAEFITLARRHWQNLPPLDLGTAANVWAALPWG